MSRHADQLARLYNKMQVRYGDQDALVQDLKKELRQVSEQTTTRGARAGLRPLTTFTDADGADGASGRPTRPLELAH